MHTDLIICAPSPYPHKARREQYLCPLSIFRTVTFSLVLWIGYVDLLVCWGDLLYHVRALTCAMLAFLVLSECF